jgi:pseudoazurin
MNLKTVAAALLIAAVGVTATVAEAAEIDVKMLNKGAAGVMVFEPALIKIAPGDTVKFLSVDKGHNAESIPGMLPDGATPFTSKMSEDVSVTFDKPGVYGIRCKPHYGLGMVALVVAGDPAVNLDAAKAIKQPGKAKQAFDALFAQLGK